MTINKSILNMQMDYIRYLRNDCINNTCFSSNAKIHKTIILTSEIQIYYFADKSEAYKYLWWAVLYSVIERIQDSGEDVLNLFPELGTTYINITEKKSQVVIAIDILRRFRNAVFHIPKEINDERIIDVIVADGLSDGLMDSLYKKVEYYVNSK
jgi:hypothetical protein